MPTNNSLVKFEYINKNSANNNRNNNTIYFDENNSSISVGEKKFCLQKVDPEVEGSITLQNGEETAIIISPDALENVDYLLLEGEKSNPIIRNVHDPLMAQDAANKNYVDNKSIADFSGILAIEHGGTGNNNGYIRTGIRANSTIGQYATAEGHDNTASGTYSHAEGHMTKATNNSHTEGYCTIASGNFSHAEGGMTDERDESNLIHLSGSNCHYQYQIEGDIYMEDLIGYYICNQQGTDRAIIINQNKDPHVVEIITSKDLGELNDVSMFINELPIGANEALGEYSHVEGVSNMAYGDGSHAEGIGTRAYGHFSHVEGRETEVSNNGLHGHAEGSYTTVTGQSAHAEGSYTKASQTAAHAEGSGTTASNYNAHAEGRDTTASGNTSHAEGQDTTASGQYSHAEGQETEASSQASHAEGYQTHASAINAHAEGSETSASGNSSHAEGENTTASGNYSHAEGASNEASGLYSHVEGFHNISQRRSQHVFGEYNSLDNSNNTNDEKGNYVEIVGNGTAVNARSNARTLDWNGNEVLAGKLTIGATPTVDMDVTNKSYVDALKPLIVTVEINNNVSFLVASKNAAEIFAAIPNRSILCLYNDIYYPLTYCSNNRAEFGYYNDANDNVKISIGALGGATINITT